MVAYRVKRPVVAFVMSFGGHGDLARAMHYLTSGQVLGDLETAKKSSAVLGADHVGVHPPHDYGLAVVLLNLADRVVPAEQVAPLSKGIDGFLLASSLAVTDPPKAVPVFESMKQYQDTLPEPSRTYMQYVNDRAVDKLGPVLLPVADALAAHLLQRLGQGRHFHESRNVAAGPDVIRLLPPLNVPEELLDLAFYRPLAYAFVRAVPTIAIALEVRGVRLPTRAHRPTRLRPAVFGRADAAIVAVALLASVVSRLELKQSSLPPAPA